MHEGHKETEPLSADVERAGKAILNSAFKVHTALGPGLLESVYEACLAEELRLVGLKVERQVGVPVSYGEARLGYLINFNALRLKDGLRRLVV